MFIKSQDSDVIFSLSDKGFFRGTIYAEDVIRNGKYYGTNIYGRRLFMTCLLGHYEEGEAEQVISEIFALMKAGAKFYTMPAPSPDIEDLGVIT